MKERVIQTVGVGLASDQSEAHHDDKHYFVEENPEGKIAVRAKGSERASRLLDTQKEAEAFVKALNPGP